MNKQEQMRKQTDVSKMTVEQLNAACAELIDHCQHEWTRCGRRFEEGIRTVWACRKCKTEMIKEPPSQNFCGDWAAFGRVVHWIETYNASRDQCRIQVCIRLLQAGLSGMTRWDVSIGFSSSITEYDHASCKDEDLRIATIRPFVTWGYGTNKLGGDES